MTNLRRRVLKPVLLVESLDERVAPSVIGAGAFLHAATAEHSTLKARAIRPRANRANHRAHFRAGVAPASGSFNYSPGLPTVTVDPPPVSTPAPSHSDNPKGSLLAASPTLSASGSAAASGQATAGGTLASGESNLTPTSTSTATTTTTATTTATPTTTTTATPTVDANQVKNGPLAKAGQTLISVYDQFKSGGVELAKSTVGELADIVGSSVRVSIQTTGANVNSVAAAMSNLGMKIDATDGNTATIEGLLPIDQLPTAAGNANVLAMNAISKPVH